MKNGLEIDEFGNKYWFKNDKFHRDDGPALEYTDGYEYWFRDGKCHREDGPAVKCVINGYKAWYLNDEKLTFNEWLIKNRKDKIEALNL